MKKQHFTIRAHCYNEDRFLIKNNLFAVIDGASGLTTEEKNGVGTNASRLAGFIKKQLSKFNGEDIPQFLHELSIYSLANGHNKETSCGITIAKIEKESIELYSLGDCEAIFQYKNGKVGKIKQNELAKFDQLAIEKMVDYAKKHNVSNKIAREHITDILIEHRNLKNKENGYSVFAPCKNPEFNIKHISLVKEDVKSLILCTDGFSQCYTTLNIFENEQQLIESKMPVKNICLKIQATCRKDKDYNKFPRFKLFDDMTVIRLDF